MVLLVKVLARVLSTGSRSLFSALFSALFLAACGNGAGFAAIDKLQEGTVNTNLSECTHDTLTTGACKVTSTGVAITANTSNITAANIKSGTTIFGVTGTLQNLLAACLDEGLNSAACSTASNRYVTPTLGSNVNGANAALVTTIPAGYYDGTRSVTASDTNLIATNIRSGTSVFGVTGTLVEILAACTNDVLNPAACSTVAGRYVTATAGANISGANAALITTIPAGFYDGTRTLTASDTNLTATNIRSGTSIFGVTGTLTPIHAACSDDSLNSSACSTAAGRYVTATAGANISGANAALITTIPAGYYDGSRTLTAADTNLIAANVRNDVEIFGVTGTYVGSGGGGTFASYMTSAGHRTLGSTPITLKQEGVDNAAAIYTNNSSGYRAVPSISGKDNDGTSGGSVTYVNRAAWGLSSCGASGTIAARITDCQNHPTIGSEARWDGAVKGNAGQGEWSLVSRTGAVGSGRGREVWRDNRTGLLWSSLVNNGTINWCRASGSNNISGNPTAEAGNGNYCTDSSNQNTGTYSGGAKAVSVCFEDGENYFSAGTATDAAGKAGLSRTSTPAVSWRLPTMYDYKIADVNGLRFIMPDMGTYNGGKEWTATLFSDSAEYVKEAFYFGSAYGEVAHGPLNSAYSARCIGR